MRWRRCWIGVFFLALLFALVAPRPGFAQQAQSGGEQEVKARALFAEGRYAEALEIYVKLYSEKTHPTYLRNIGRCYQNLEQPDKAISSFHEYLRQAKGLTPEQREQIEGYIREMEELKRRQEASSPPGPVTGAATGPVVGKPADGEPRPSEPPPKVGPPTGTEPATGGEPPRAEAAAWRRRVALGLGGLGVIGLGVGAWFGLDARSNWNDATSACPTPSATGCSASARQSERNASRSAEVATVSVAAGGVLLTTGAILWALSRERSDEHVTTGMQFVPQVGAGIVSGAIAGTF